MTVAVDTSVAVPLVIQAHSDHAAVTRWWNHQDVALSGHALAETYSVITRLPGGLRLPTAEAALLLRDRFLPPLLMSDVELCKLPDTLNLLGIGGGAVYDALVALAAKEHDVSLATRDARARTTYEAVGVKTITVA